MIGKRRRERRRQARAAIERYEQQLRGAQFIHESDVAERDKALEEARRERRASAGLVQRLDDANAELRRWGLEPVTRDVAESPEHPQRYRRHSDWRTTRSPDELTALFERSLADTGGVYASEVKVDWGDGPHVAPSHDVTVDYWHDDPTKFLRATGEDAVTHAYEPPPIAPALEKVKRDHLKRLAAALDLPVEILDSPSPTVKGLQESLRVVRAEHQRREDRATERIANLRGALGEAHAALRRSKLAERGRSRRITQLVAELDDVRGEYAGYRVGALAAEADYERRLGEIPNLGEGDTVQIGVGSHVHMGTVAEVHRSGHVVVIRLAT